MVFPPSRVEPHTTEREEEIPLHGQSAVKGFDSGPNKRYRTESNSFQQPYGSRQLARAHLP
ncbi:hypothetical protein GCM10027091_15250 [Streptomyces daliensis]